MFFRECAQFAELHADLAPTIQRLDACLGEMGDAEVLRAEDLAGLIGADPNQVSSVLEHLADGKILSRDEMVECRSCGMVVPRDDYRAQLDEDGECPCSDCERPLTGASIRPITTYRRGEAWKVAQPPPERVYEASVPSSVGLDDTAFYTHIDLARIFCVNQEALRKRLDRYRLTDFGDDWKEQTSRRPREPKYLYRLKAVRPIVEVLLASSERPAK